MLRQIAIFVIAAHLGLPGHVLVGWAGALAHMERHFLIRNSLSAGIPSVTGFPEGCGLSCIAMLIVDAACHRWQQVFFPLCAALSYVDDWQLICSHHSFLPEANRCLDAFIQAVDLKLDERKSYDSQLRGGGVCVTWESR